MLENRSKRGERREESTDKSSRMHENAQRGNLELEIDRSMRFRSNGKLKFERKYRIVS